SMVAKYPATANFAVVAGLIITGLVGAIFALPIFGVWVVIPLSLAMSGLGFFVSHYLNIWARPKMRATVLSFRGVALNLAYGSAGLLFAGLTKRLHAASPGAGENTIFSESLHYLAPAFLVMAVVVGLYALASRKKCRACAASSDVTGSI
ncbi:MAG: hypothetical protein ACREKL_01145, partial [Chthoniobacterales bacterium]